MRHDDLEARIDRAARIAPGDAPPAFLRTVTRRRWKRRAPLIAAAIVVILGGGAASLLSRGPANGPSFPDPVIADAPAPRINSASLAALRRDGLDAEGLAAPRAFSASSAAGPRAERPLRAFEVSRVLRGF